MLLNNHQLKEKGSKCDAVQKLEINSMVRNVGFVWGLENIQQFIVDNHANFPYESVILFPFQTFCGLSTVKLSTLDLI